MDRQTVYFGQVPLETDLLKQSQNAMVGLAKLAAGVYGTNTLVNAFTVTPTGPASLNVIVTAGEIYQIENLEASTWSSLGTDTHSIVKQGLLLDPLTFGITPPGTVGFSQAFLIEVQYADSDTGSLVLPYYNAAVPSSPFSGPGNAGSAQNTVRKGVAAVQVKAGIAATTGTQTTPTADAGWTGIYVITVANGAATITSGNITKLSTAPFLATNGYLPQIPNGVQEGTWVYAPDTSGVANTVTCAVAPALPAYVVGTVIVVKLANGISGATTLNVNGLGAISVVHYDGTALTVGDGVANQLVAFVFDGTNFQIAWRSGTNNIIDTTVTYTVHGSTPNFTDLNAAFEYLSKFIITHNGRVNLQLAGAVAAPSTVFTYTSQVLLDHPQNHRIFILGKAMLATVPSTSSSYTLTGNGSGARGTDSTANLAFLRTKFATELHFTGGFGVEVIGINLGTWDAILMTGDSTNGAGQQGLMTITAANGENNVPTPISHNGCAFVQSGSAGLYMGQGGNLTQFGLSFPVVCLGNVADGVLANAGALFQSVGAVLSYSNGGSGIDIANASWGFADSYWECSFNAGPGISVLAGSTFSCIGATKIWGNGGNGITASGGSRGSATADFGSGGNANGSGSVNANDMTMINIVSSSNVGALSPALNTVGNSNSIITNT